MELPPGPAHFVDRDEQRERVLRAVREWRGRSRPLLVALSGPGGIGKTELARLIARVVRGSFPDGVRSVDLDDFRLGGELDPGEVVAHLLESLDVEPAFVAAQYKARCAQYWRRTADAKLILIVDNARYASEVVPLLPASGDSMVIVTSHGPLHEFEDGAVVGLTLPPLEEWAATELLGLIVQDPRLAADAEAVRTLVRLCEGMPAALHAAGEWVRAHRLRPLSRLVPQLRGEFEEKGVTGVERVWDTVYGDLSPTAALLYRLLPYHPAAAFTLESATALLGLGPDACEDALEELHRWGLLELSATPDTAGAPDRADMPDAMAGMAGMAAPATRMRLPGPLRGHAVRRSRKDAREGETQRALTRLVRWFVRQAQRADRFAAGRRLTVVTEFAPVPDAPDVLLEDPEDTTDPESRAERADHASRWLYEERHALFACARLAHEHGLDTEAVALSEPVWTYALDHPHQSDIIGVMRLAVDCAVRHGANASWLVRTRCQLARHLWEAGLFAEAERELDHAEAVLGLLGDSERDRKLAASTYQFRGELNGARGRWQDAVADFTRCRDLHAEIPNPYGVMLLTYQLGKAALELGDLDTAHRLLAPAHDDAVELRRERLTRRTGFALAGVLCRLGRTDEARPLYEESLQAAIRRRTGFDQARVLDALANLAETEGRSAEAMEHRAAADEIRRRNGLDDSGGTP
ncbi:tetratricopeptide repeat protein [Streptomyces sp. NPDC018693]|uniref:tetratricopeptide repeat protein n=1 Tax=unclassified Streptomyces TaxID=2593676 RepID=UPI003790873C